mgnify:CR=1 FL=1
MAVVPWPVLVFPVLAVVAGVGVFLDARDRGRDTGIAALVGAAIGGLFLAGTVPSLVALAITDAPATQGFPTAIRVVPGFAALGIYLVLR